jgi:hypothetical protein
MILLLVADVLAFHDLFEPHAAKAAFGATVRLASRSAHRHPVTIARQRPGSGPWVWRPVRT